MGMPRRSAYIAPDVGIASLSYRPPRISFQYHFSSYPLPSAASCDCRATCPVASRSATDKALSLFPHEHGLKPTITALSSNTSLIVERRSPAVLRPGNAGRYLGQIRQRAGQHSAFIPRRRASAPSRSFLCSQGHSGYSSRQCRCSKCSAAPLDADIAYGSKSRHRNCMARPDGDAGSHAADGFRAMMKLSRWPRQIPIMSMRGSVIVARIVASLVKSLCCAEHFHAFQSNQLHDILCGHQISSRHGSVITMKIAFSSWYSNNPAGRQHHGVKTVHSHGMTAFILGRRKHRGNVTGNLSVARLGTTVAIMSRRRAA